MGQKKKPGQRMLPRPKIAPELLKTRSASLLERYRIASQGADPHEVRVREPGHRVGPLRVIEHVLRLDADFRVRAPERNRAEERGIKVPVRWTAELVPSAVPPLVARLREHRRIVPRLVGAGGSEAGLGIADRAGVVCEPGPLLQ